jgi:hypothetical protein
MALNGWSQVTIHASLMCCSIGLHHEGVYHVCKTLQKLLANIPNRYRQAEFMRMTGPLPRAVFMKWKSDLRKWLPWLMIKLIPVSFS